MTEKYSSTVLSHWEQINSEIWTPLQKRKDARDDIYIELLRYFWNKTQRELDDEVLSDPLKAKEIFKAISKDEISSESSCIGILEGFYDVLKEFETGISDIYVDRLRDFCSTYNLRYIITDDCKFRLTINGILAGQINHLKKALSGNPHNNDMLVELENTLSRLRETNEPQSCIRVACNLLEQIVKDRTNINETLGRALNNSRELNLFPHDAVCVSLQKLYKFASDYPNIRHAGNPTSKKRDLENEDAILFITLTIGYATFLCETINCELLITGDDEN
ncbi:MAG: hypothetical protein ABOK23_05870 [Candidatus Methanoperedens sp.]|nr:hypothetical protein [Candidatus Methanoperedens sp.]MCZ7396527.1 hypothetical protein [Candidatus Methanoperedens sp.]